MKRLKLVLVTILSVLLIAQTSVPVAAKDNWLSVRSKNFLLVGNGNEKEIRQVGLRLEQFREVFSYLFPKANFSSPVPTTVIVFKSDSSYRPFKPNANLAGYFQPGPDVNYITLTTETRGEQDPFSVIFHEYTHLLVNNTVGNVPIWFNEGLAEYYSSFSITDDQKIMIGKPIGSHVFLLRENKMLPLRTLFQVDQHSPYYNERDKQSIFYAESWALIHYLILGKPRLTELGRFVKLMDTNMSMEKAFQEAFQVSFEEMEKELREYIKRDRYPVQTGHFEKKLDFDKEMETTPLSDAEAQAYLGDLLLHSNRADCESYLQKALALDPNLAMAHASMGMARVRQGKLDEARQSLERALAANSSNYLIHYYYAFALSRQRTDGAGMTYGYGPEITAKLRDELKKAIQLRPDFVESYSLLAFINLVSGDQLDESKNLLKQALTISPGRNDLYLMMAQIYLRQGNNKDARQLLERLSQGNGDEELRLHAKQLLTQLSSREEQMARFEEMKKSAETNGLGPPRLTRREATGQDPAAQPVDPYSYLEEALRKPGEGETQIQGTLIRLDCDAKGITFAVKLEDRLLRLHTDRFENMTITAYTTDAGGEITCGPRKPENPVVVCYVPTGNARAKTDGVIKSLEFVPKEFKLKVQP